MMRTTSIVWTEADSDEGLTCRDCGENFQRLADDRCRVCWTDDDEGQQEAAGDLAADR